MSLENCFKTGGLKRVDPSRSMALKFLERGQDILSEVRELVADGFLEVAEQRLYQACFHMIKALLWNDGLKEHSHYCTLLYAKENYGESLDDELLIVDNLRDLRNQSQYGFEPISIDTEDFDKWFQAAELLHDKVSDLLKS